MLPVLQQEGLKCLFFVTAGSAGEERKTLWYEDLFLFFISMPQGRFEFSRDGIEIRGEVGARQQRRSLWWNSVQRLSQLDAGARTLSWPRCASESGPHHFAVSTAAIRLRAAGSD